MFAKFVGVELKGLYPSFKGKENLSHVGKFHVLVVQRRQRNAGTKKFKSCCFANLILILFSRSRCRRRRRCLSCVM